MFLGPVAGPWIKSRGELPSLFIREPVDLEFLLSCLLDCHAMSRSTPVRRDHYRKRIDLTNDSPGAIMQELNRLNELAARRTVLPYAVST